MSVYATAPAMAGPVIETARVVSDFRTGVWSPAEMLSAPDPKTALARLRHASVRYDAALLDAVRPSLNDPDPKVREMAVETVIAAPGGGEGAAYWEFIQEALRDPAPSVREGRRTRPGWR